MGVFPTERDITLPIGRVNRVTRILPDFTKTLFLPDNGDAPCLGSFPTTCC